MIFVSIGLSHLLPPGPFYYGSTLGLKLLSWDGRWYFDIAFNGYKWDAINGIRSAHYQNIAFFPTYPLIERALIWIFGSINPFVFIVPGLMFGLLSNAVFYQFMKTRVSSEDAWWATALYAVWPASCFFVMGYPTGLINLLAIVCMRNYLQGRIFRAAFWCGLGSATAPTFVFLAAGLCLHQAYEWLSSDKSQAKIFETLLFGLISVSGLIAFMIYQGMFFHDIFAFQKAQLAWARKQTIIEHIKILINPIWYFLGGYFIVTMTTDLIAHCQIVIISTRERINEFFQFFLNQLGNLCISL